MVCYSLLVVEFRPHILRAVSTFRTEALFVSANGADYTSHLGALRRPPKATAHGSPTSGVCGERLEGNAVGVCA